jgi:hypothetical protein
VIPEGLKSGEQAGCGGKQVFWLPLASSKYRLDSLHPHHEVGQIFIVWLGRSDFRWERGCGSHAKRPLNLYHS